MSQNTGWCKKPYCFGPNSRLCTVFLSAVTVAVSAIPSSTSVSESHHSTSGSDSHSPPTVVVLPPRHQTDDHVTNVTADYTARSPPETSDRSPSCAGDSCLPVTGGAVRTVEERSGIAIRTSNANVVCSNGRPFATGATKTSHSSRSGGLHRRLNAIIRDRIVFFTKKDRSTSATS